MSDEESVEREISIYVLPSETNLPARAVVSRIEKVENGYEVSESMATWMADDGSWAIAGKPVSQELSEAISAHAGSLGVPGFSA